MVSAFKFLPGAGEMAQWNYGFSRFADAVKDFGPAYKVIIEDFKKGETKQFSTEGTYGSGGWKPLSDNPEGRGYASWKEQHKPGMPILVFSGLLKKAATEPKTEIKGSTLTITIDDSGSYQMFSKRRGLVTVHKPAVAGYHQKGGGRLPRRPVIQLPQSQVVRWRKIFQSYLVAKERETFGGPRV